MTFDIRTSPNRSCAPTQYSYATNTYYDFGSVYMFGVRARSSRPLG